MKQCPVCSMDLAPADYEGFRVLQCNQCRGHLVPLQRLESIRRVDRKSDAALKAEASSGFRASSGETLKCPRCRRSMRKEAGGRPVLELQMDVCRGCGLVWLDGGELALLQLAYQATTRSMDAREFKRRMEELEASPERKARFEEDLARPPEATGPWEEALGEAGDQVLGALLRAGRYCR